MVPAWIKDAELERAARYRSLNRLPALCWRHAGRGAVLLRSSQPSAGLFGWRCAEDELLLNAFTMAAAIQPGPPAPATAAAAPPASASVQKANKIPLTNGHLGHMESQSSCGEADLESKMYSVTTGKRITDVVNVKPLLVLDARSYAAAWANRAKGGGFESPGK